MKILQVNKYFWIKGGSEAYYFSLCDLLQSRGHEVMHFSTHDPRNFPSPYQSHFVSEIDFRTRGRRLEKTAHFLYSTEAKQKMIQLIRETKPDLIHLHNISHQLTPAIIPAAKSFHLPVVQTLHDFQLICPNYKLFTEGAVCERCFPRRYYQAMLHRCLMDSRTGGALGGLEMALHRVVLKTYDQVDRFICPSQFLYRKLIDWKIPAEKLIYIPHPTPVPDADQIRFAKLPKTNELVFAGRLNQEKGIDVLIQVARRLPDFQFVIYGEAETDQELQRLKMSAQGTQNMEWKGRVGNRSELFQRIASARAVIVPSVAYENAPMAVLEALSLGTWVIGANHGGFPELIEKNKNGLLFEPGSRDELVARIQALRSLPDRPLQKLKNQYTSAFHYDRLMEVYQALL